MYVIEWIAQCIYHVYLDSLARIKTYAKWAVNRSLLVVLFVMLSNAQFRAPGRCFVDIARSGHVMIKMLGMK